MASSASHQVRLARPGEAPGATVLGRGSASGVGSGSSPGAPGCSLTTRSGSPPPATGRHYQPGVLSLEPVAPRVPGTQRRPWRYHALSLARRVAMPDVLIRDVPEGVLTAIDAKA